MISDNYNAFKNFINETNNKNNSETESAIEKLQNEFQILINENLMKIEILENHIDEVEKKNKSLQQNNDDLTKELNDKINIIDAQIKEKNDLFKSKLDEITKLNATINNRQQQIQIGLKRIEILEKKINELGLNSDENELKNLQTSLKQKEETNKKLQNDLNELNFAKENLEKENEQLTTDNAKLKSDKQNLEDDIKENEEKYIKEKEKLIEENKSLINDITEINETNKLYSDNMVNIINNYSTEIDNKDRQLLAITKDIVDLLGITNNIDLKKIDDIVIIVDDLKNNLTKIKDNKDCSNEENLIGKIDNVCLYANKNNGIDAISNDDIMIEELLKENNKLKEKVKTEIANIEKNNNAKIEELRNKYSQPEP
jgi:chromosome segregation ATPase